ncbi:Type IV secretion system protein [Rhizobiales bacterium GAS191]|nr:Type IV secretion system protein [Rhizobiales bacterium GAS191]
MRKSCGTLLAVAVASLIGLASEPSNAQVPVIDTATLTQATQTASNTASIMQTNQQILTQVQQTLQAVTGNRTTGSIGSSALGSGFSMSGAPSLTSVLNGGTMTWGNLGSFGQTAATIINGLSLIKSLTGNSTPTGVDQAYLGGVNTAAAIAGIVGGTQSAASSRSSAFQSAGSQIGSAPDIKGSIDQNSQLQVQTGLTINELIGAINATNASLNAQQMQELAGLAKLAAVMTYDPSKAVFVPPGLATGGSSR